MSFLQDNRILPADMPDAAQYRGMDTLFEYFMPFYITRYPRVLANIYARYGIVSRIIDEPVEDVLNKKPEIIIDDIEEEQYRQLLDRLSELKVYAHLEQAVKWARLFGSAYFVLHDGKELDSQEFEALEEIGVYTGTRSDKVPVDKGGYYKIGDFKIAQNKVVVIINRPKVPYIESLSDFWGLSELEKVQSGVYEYLQYRDLLIRSVRKFSQDVIKVKGYAADIDLADDESDVAKRVASITEAAMFGNTLLLDKEDDYTSTSRNIKGVADTWPALKDVLSIESGIRKFKLSGDTSQGFNSGSSELDSYDMLLGGIRNKIEEPLSLVIKQLLFEITGKADVIFRIQWNNSRPQTQEQKAKEDETSLKNVLETYKAGLLGLEEARKLINSLDVFPHSLEEEEDEGEDDYEEI